MLVFVVSYAVMIGFNLEDTVGSAPYVTTRSDSPLRSMGGLEDDEGVLIQKLHELDLLPTSQQKLDGKPGMARHSALQVDHDPIKVRTMRPE
ncbi:hypothetical protein [Bradyrhizobium sp. BR 10261]|uniref:hypothetical protein n=1 Tax=Bradyrhizobium sp. BR 10261 TaxID=2749992 RepID=UPI001C645A63|nr:hypothetical protein [Bradyrhizobium sp. BR 10261]MBW7967158.1 hypothetical protein [Bradyrhizobium sp. BR 10261]